MKMKMPTINKVVDLPAEIWIQILYLAADDTDRDECFLMETLERRNYAMKKVNIYLSLVLGPHSYTLINRQSFLLVNVGGSWHLNTFSIRSW